MEEIEYLLVSEGDSKKIEYIIKSFERDLDDIQGHGTIANAKLADEFKDELTEIIRLVKESNYESRKWRTITGEHIEGDSNSGFPISIGRVLLFGASNMLQLEDISKLSILQQHTPIAVIEFSGLNDSVCYLHINDVTEAGVFSTTDSWLDNDGNELQNIDNFQYDTYMDARIVRVIQQQDDNPH